jgi:hypothetical protein
MFSNSLKLNIDVHFKEIILIKPHKNLAAKCTRCIFAPQINNAALYNGFNTIACLEKESA